MWSRETVARPALGAVVLGMWPEQAGRLVRWAVMIDGGWHTVDVDGRPLNPCPAPAWWCPGPVADDGPALIEQQERQAA